MLIEFGSVSTHQLADLIQHLGVCQLLCIAGVIALKEHAGDVSVAFGDMTVKSVVADVGRASLGVIRQSGVQVSELTRMKHQYRRIAHEALIT